MSLFGKKSPQQDESVSAVLPPLDTPHAAPADLEKLALSVIKDGVFIVNKDRLVQLANPAGITLTGEKDAELIIGMDAALSIKLENENGDLLLIEQNPVFRAVEKNEPFESRDLVLVSNEGNKKIPVEISVIPSGDQGSDRIITIRDITREKNEGDAQFEFISTASHEMRTPVASIEGYLGLTLNPQTATIDDRAKKYLEAAHTASQHLGKLFQDLLDVTKLDDRKIQPHFRPIILADFLGQIVGGFQEKAKAKNVQLAFVSVSSGKSMRTIGQAIYVYVDIDFLNEIVSNLIDNAIKYTPSGKKIDVDLTTKDDQAIISVKDEGIGIASVDIKHIFQKFYRADNSQTREIGGTGLGLYIVKQRTNALNGKVWAESVFGQGSTFFVSLPRLSQEEYDKRMISFLNEQQLEKMQQMKQYQEISDRVLGGGQQTASDQTAQTLIDQAPLGAQQTGAQMTQGLPQLQAPVDQSAQPLPQIQELPATQFQEPTLNTQYVQATQPANPVQPPAGNMASPQVLPPPVIPTVPPNSIQNNQNIIQ